MLKHLALSWNCRIFAEKMGKVIYVTCYGQRERWTSRKKAMAFYLEAMNNTEGSERERYTKIYCELADGLDECSDS